MAPQKKTTALAPAMVEGLSQEKVDLVKRTVARGATNDELALFLYTANRTGLDPLTKQIHFIKRRVWNGAKRAYDEIGTTQTGIDGYRAIAARTGELAGIDDAVYDSEEGVNPVKASVTVWRLVKGNRVSFTATARWAEYVATTKEGQPQAMWKKMPYLMLAKCAEALALRKAFPNELSGLYTNEEMAQADEAKIYTAEYDQTPIEKNAKAISSGDDLGDIQVEPTTEIETNGETRGPTPTKFVPKEFICSDTGVGITQAEYDWSMKFYGMPLSRAAQKNHKK